VPSESSRTGASAASKGSFPQHRSACARTAQSSPRAKCSIIASTVSAIGSACTPAELVRMTSEATISG